MSLHYQTNKRLVAALGSTNLLGCTRGSVCIGAARFCAPFPVAPLHTDCPFSLSPPPLPPPVYTRCVSFHARAHTMRARLRWQLGRRVKCAYYGLWCAVAWALCFAPAHVCMRAMRLRVARAQFFSCTRVHLCLRPCARACVVLYLLGERLKRYWRWPSASEVSAFQLPNEG